MLPITCLRGLIECLFFLGYAFLLEAAKFDGFFIKAADEARFLDLQIAELLKDERVSSHNPSSLCEPRRTNSKLLSSGFR